MGEERYTGPERRVDGIPTEIEPVRLTRKYSDCIDGIDLSTHDVGDRIPLPERDAHLLMAEGWAEPVSPDERRH